MNQPKSIVEWLLPIERDFFLWLNQHHSDFLDSFMSTYSDKNTWIFLAIVAAFALLYKVNWRIVLLCIISGLLVGLLCDYFAAQFIKPFFSRLRPTHHPDFQNLVHVVDGYRGGKFGFISNHASNGFGIAAFVSLLFRNKLLAYTLFSWATITIYSRVYLGVHFVSDVIAGACWGLICGTLSYYVFIYLRRKLFDFSELSCNAVPHLLCWRAYVICGAIYVTFFVILFYSIIHVYT